LRSVAIPVFVPMALAIYRRENGSCSSRKSRTLMPFSPRASRSHRRRS